MLSSPCPRGIVRRIPSPQLQPSRPDGPVLPPNLGMSVSSPPCCPKYRSNPPHHHHHQPTNIRSVFGMYKASGVPLPAYSPPGANSGLGGAAKRYGVPAPRSTYPVLPTPHGGGGGGGGGGGSSSSSVGSGGRGSGWSAADGRGGGKGKAGVAAAGGAGVGSAYRVDSFVHKRTSWKYTLDWVSLCRVNSSRERSERERERERGGKNGHRAAEQ